ncbi:hypothetical protein HN51_047743 [Arachis hypogaea]
MAFSPTEEGSITTFTNPTLGDEQFNMDESDIQEQVGCKFDEITNVVVTRKDELDDGGQDEVHLPSDNDHHGSLNKRCEDSTMWNSSEGGGFMHLLNSFRHI